MAEMLVNVLGLDPGKTTGYCMLTSDGKDDEGLFNLEVIKWGEILWDERFSAILDLLMSVSVRPNPWVVYESFNLYQHSAQGQAQIHSDFPSVQVIGIIQALTYQNYPELVDKMVTQPASVRKRVNTPPFVRGAHAKDAYRHARYFVVTGQKRWNSSPTR